MFTFFLKIIWFKRENRNISLSNILERFDFDWLNRSLNLCAYVQPWDAQFESTKPPTIFWVSRKLNGQSYADADASFDLSKDVGAP